MKTCSKCKTEKLFSEFGKHNQTKDGLKSRCKDCNAFEMREFYSRNKLSVKNTVKTWIEKNRLKHAIYVKNWANKNSEYKKFLNSQWKKSNKDLVNESTQKRRATRRCQLGDVSKNIVEKLLKTQNNMCINCRIDLSKSGYHIDHNMPLSLGGLHDDKNLQLLCPTCNMKKGSKDPIVWANENGRLL